MSIRKPVAALAAVAASVALAVGPASASAAAKAAPPGVPAFPYVPVAQFLCGSLGLQATGAGFIGNSTLSGLLVQTTGDLGCPALFSP